MLFVAFAVAYDMCPRLDQVSAPAFDWFRYVAPGVVFTYVGMICAYLNYPRELVSSKFHEVIRWFHAGWGVVDGIVRAPSHAASLPIGLPLLLLFLFSSSTFVCV